MTADEDDAGEMLVDAAVWIDAGEMWWAWVDAAMWIAADADPSPPPPEDR